MTKHKHFTRSYVLQGLVQGQGVRPTVARIAKDLCLTGSVRNVGEGVAIHVCGTSEAVVSFELHLSESLTAHIRTVESTATSCSSSEFQILSSSPSARVQTLVPQDLATCVECMDEVRSPSSRRYRYAFSSCTRCGPRYSIIAQMPFDRSRTSMNSFPMCSSCKAEYYSTPERRFHAQTNACPDCGPCCWSENSFGDCVSSGFDAIRFIANAISRGETAAIKGIGGYQLLCDATNNRAVTRLRHRKRRPAKPLPIMVAELDAAKEFARVNSLEDASLSSPVNPIVLLESRSNPLLSPAIHPSLCDVGIMLPTSPLHWLIVDLVQRPLVVTSANAHGSPLIYQTSNAFCDLRSIADVWLHHDREILRPVDDSVVRCFGDHCMTLRAGRGLAPLAINTGNSAPMLALGGHQKVAVAISAEDHLVLGPHIGDMETEPCRLRYREQLKNQLSLYAVSPELFVCDLHPNYFTSDLTNQIASKSIQVQHHHAHVAAAMLEHDLVDRNVLGFAFDGTGYGADQTIWGGEILTGSVGNFLRVAHLKPFRLPAGEVAVKEPWRVAASLIHQSCGDDSLNKWLRRFELSKSESIRYLLNHGPLTTSMGRLFDGVAAMVLSTHACSYEGEAAMMLEAACDRSEQTSYAFEFVEGTKGDPIMLDWCPVIQQIAMDIDVLSPNQISMKFHRAVANLVVESAARFCGLPLLCGGVFQNKTLLELIHEIGSKAGLSFFYPGRIPTNDGGLAVGQLVVASAKARSSHSEEATEDKYRCV